MKEINDNIWKLWQKGAMIVIPTNGFVKNNGEAVMGRGLAYQASLRFPELPNALGYNIKMYGNKVFIFPQENLFTFPVKHNWWEEANLQLIESSAIQLQQLINKIELKIPYPIYIPHVGCGNGKLDWIKVKPIIEKYLDNEKVIICDRSQN